LEKLYDKSWAVLIGIGEFNHKLIPILPSALNDVTRMKEILVKYCDYDDKNIIVITNKNATSRGIRSFFENDFYKKVKADDRVLIFYSGHGTTRQPHGRESERGYIATYDADFIGDEIDWTSMLQLDEFVPLVAKNLSSRQLLFMFDCCFSGIISQPPEYESQRENRCETDMIKAAKEKRSVQIYAGASRDEEILASSGVVPPLSVLVDSIERIIKNEKPTNYPEKFISAHKLSKNVTMLVRETSIYLKRPQNPVYYFSNLDDRGEFVFKQFTDDEIKNAVDAVKIKFEPIEELLRNTEVVNAFKEELLPSYRRYVEHFHGFDYSLMQLRNTMHDFVRQNGEIKTFVDELVLPNGIQKDGVFNYIAENIISLGLVKGVFKPKFVQYHVDKKEDAT